MTEIKFENLQISNDYMFKEVMKSNKGLCKILVGSIMQQEIEDIVYIETEKTLQPYYDSRGIRLDVILADENHTRYNLEMQARNVISKAGVALLPKRTRYYQSVIDMDMLKKGQDFDQLNPLVLIFICTFDFYNEGRYVYTFKSRCLENLELELANDVTVKLVNAKGKHGKVNTLLKNFLQYVITNKPVDDFTKDVERQVWAVKNDKKAREEYMVLQAKIREHEIVAFEAGEAQGLAKGLAEGEAKGRAEGLAVGEAKGEANQIIAMVERKMKVKHMTCEEAMDDLDCTPKERQAYYEYVAKNK
ncbi:MAG: Rpn family recombination-promoting nuclease/putative transposase [Phascolarctobacterium sp.]|nr:Rpn family recombination-promoting nuclease/putative transposase [Phascolarctobacterium sp.]